MSGIKSKLVSIVAPSNSGIDLHPSVIEIGVKRLKKKGFEVTFEKNINSTTFLGMGAVDQKILDMVHASERQAGIIMPIFGGYNSNSVLDEVLLKQLNRATIVGYSDTTALLNAAYSICKSSSIHGLSFASLCEPELDSVSERVFFDALSSKKGVVISGSDYYHGDFWFMNDDKKPHKTIKSIGWQCLNPGKQRGILLGGNIETFLLLSGTKYIPETKNSIFLIEVSPGTPSKKIFSMFTQLTQMKVFEGIVGLIIGVINPVSQKDDSQMILDMLRELRIEICFPIVSNTNFSHFSPIYSIPVGREVELCADTNWNYIKLL